MGQGRGREDATADSSASAKGPDCVDMQRRENQRSEGKVREQGETKKDFKAGGSFCVIIDGLSWWESGYKQESGDNEAFLLQSIALLYHSLPGAVNGKEEACLSLQAYQSRTILSASSYRHSDRADICWTPENAVPLLRSPLQSEEGMRLNFGQWRH